MDSAPFQGQFFNEEIILNSIPFGSVSSLSNWTSFLYLIKVDQIQKCIQLHLPLMVGSISKAKKIGNFNLK